MINDYAIDAESQEHCFFGGWVECEIRRLL